MQVAPLPPRLLPQSKLGVALAVYLLLARFDDHVAYDTLERIFRERHGDVFLDFQGTRGRDAPMPNWPISPAPSKPTCG